MSIYVDKRTNIIYVNFVYKGIRCRESLKLKANRQNLKLAKRIDNEIHGLISAGKFNYEDYFPNSQKLKLFNKVPAKDKNIKFSHYAAEWIQRKEKEYKNNLLKYSTLKSYKIAVNKLKKSSFYNKYLNQITVGEIKNFILELSKDLATKSVVNTLTPLRQIFNDAFLDKLLKENPMNYIKNPKVEKPDIEPFTKEEILIILPYFEKHYPQIYAFIATLVYTGMRVGEALAMKWENFDFNDWTYYIKENRVEGRLTTPKTRESKRLIKIPLPLQEAIEKHKIYSFMKSEFVFLNNYGKPYHKSSTIIKNFWKPALKELGIRYRTLYQLRHTHAILSLIAGDNPHDVAKRLGHKDLQTLFTRYAKFLKSTFQPTKLETFLNSNSSKDKNVSIPSAFKY